MIGDGALYGTAHSGHTEEAGIFFNAQMLVRNLLLCKLGQKSHDGLAVQRARQPEPEVHTCCREYNLMMLTRNSTRR